MWIEALPERQECSRGNLENLFKSLCHFLCFFQLFQAVSKNSLCCQDLIRFDCQCAFFAATNHGQSITVVFCLWCHQFREITIWPTPWRGFCGHQDIDPGGVFAEGQRTEEGRKCLEDGRNGVLNWYCMNWYELISELIWIDMNWYELIWIVHPLHGSPPHFV